MGVLTYELLTGATPFTGDTALAVAYQRMDHDVAPPSTVIDGVPPQFDELVRRATARDPADRYADARDMGAAVDAIAAELGLPAFRVPAPRNSAQHASAILHASRIEQQRTTGELIAPRRRPTRRRPGRRVDPPVALTRGPDDWRGHTPARTMTNTPSAGKPFRRHRDGRVRVGAAALAGA